MMPREILRKAILSALFIHILLFIVVAIPSGSPPTRKKFVRVSLYPVAGGKTKEEIKELPRMENVEKGQEIKAENIIIEEPKKKETVENKKSLKEEPPKSKPIKGKTQKEEKPKKPEVSKKDKEKKSAELTEGRKEGEEESKKGTAKDKRKLSQKPSGGRAEPEGEKGRSGEGTGKIEKGEEVEEFIPEDIKSEYASILWKTVKERWAILSPLKGKNLKVEVSVKISPEGKVLERKVEKSSGNSTFDALALNVIDSIETFLPPPWNPKKPVDIIFIFSSE